MHSDPDGLFQTVFNTLHIGIKVWELENPDDPGSLRLIASNPAASEATGVARDLVIGKTIAEGFPQAVPDGIAEQFAEVARTGKAKDMGELTYSDPRVREGVFSIYAFPLPGNRVGVAFENVTKRKLELAAIERKASFVHLLQEIAVAINEAGTPDEAFQKCLDDVCEHTRWPVGHVYRHSPQGDDLTPTALWHLDDPKVFATFKEVTERTSFRPGEGLPGRVSESGKPAWIMDVTRDSNFPRARAVENIGVKAAFGFPVMVGKEVAAVLEFFSPQAKVPDQLLMDVMEQVGIQLGRVIERERAWSVAHPVA